MKNVIEAMIATTILVLASTCAWAADVKIVANADISASSVSVDDLRSVFLEKTNALSDGTHVEPVLSKGGAAHEAFLKQYLDKNDAALQIYYRSLVFTGKASMPKVVGSDAEMISYVAKTKGAIGYVSKGASTEGVKVLEVK